MPPRLFLSVRLSFCFWPGLSWRHRKHGPDEQKVGATEKSGGFPQRKAERPAYPTVWTIDLRAERQDPAHCLPPPWRRRLLKAGRRGRQIIARDQPRDFPEILGKHLFNGQGAGLGRRGGRGLPIYLAAPEATPQIGSDGEELARRRYLYGFPPVLESGNGRGVVTRKISPGNRASACQVGLALHSNHSKGSVCRGGMNIVEPFVGSGGLAATGETRRPCAVIYAFPGQLPSGFRGTTARKGGGGVSSENGVSARARARLRAWLDTHGPRGLLMRLRRSLS